MGNDADGNAIFEERECEAPPTIKQTRKELIVAYINERYDPDDQIAIMANYAAVSAGIATPPPDDVVAKYTREHEAFQKVRKEAKAYAKKVLGGADE